MTAFRISSLLVPMEWPSCQAVAMAASGRHARCCSEPSSFRPPWVISIVVGPFDAGSVPDIAVGAPSGHVSILLGHGDGSFSISQTLAEPNFCPAPSLAIGDFNRDAAFDLVVGGIGCEPVVGWFGRGNGTFGSPQPVAVRGGALQVGNFPA